MHGQFREVIKSMAHKGTYGSNVQGSSHSGMKPRQVKRLKGGVSRMTTRRNFARNALNKK